MIKTLERTHKYFKKEELTIDLSSSEGAIKTISEISIGSYARGELAALIWLTDSKSLNYKAVELIKWRMNNVMDCLDGLLTYDDLVPIPDFCD